MIQEKFISLETAKAIFELAKEKGVELPESERAWRVGVSGGSTGFLQLGTSKRFSGSHPECNDYPAYDTYELFEIIGKLSCHISHIYPNAGYWNLTCATLGESFIEEEIAESLGKMYEYLLKEGLIK